jgi:glycosyltransferase involved in cell wall biosynthesis
MRICLISVEIFAWGKYGGFGRATRVIGAELAKRGVEVYAVVPRRAGQGALEHLDGITVLGFDRFRPWSAKQLLQSCDADVYHSCEPSLATCLALTAMPDRRHIVTLRDPRDFDDWRVEFAMPSLNKWQVVGNYLYESNPLVRATVRRVDAVYITAFSLASKAKQLYRLKKDPEWLPTPVKVPLRIQKADTPTVCYLGRLDRRKRPGRFFDLAGRFPQVRFIAMGTSRDPHWERELRSRYASCPNIEFAGFIDQFSSPRYAEILEQSWVIINPAVREGLPNAFLEAASYQCAILSAVDPDGFASRFGYRVTDDDFASGLAFLLENEKWRDRGLRGHEYVKQHFEVERAIASHVAAYHGALSAAPAR